MASLLRAQDHELHVAGEGPVFHLCFAERQPRNYRDLLASDRQKYSNFTLALLDEGVLTLPDGRWYLSTAHTDEDIERTLEAVARTLD
jgi:glutamate-1-semialdehyde 2,1-aminomutase